MSRTKKGAKGPGYEYWSRRSHKWMTQPGKDAKKVTHRHERATGKKQTKEQTKE